MSVDTKESYQPVVGVLGAKSLVGEGLLEQLSRQNWQVAAFSRHIQAPAEGRGEPHPIAWFLPGCQQPFDEEIHYWICLAPIWVLPEYFGWIRACGARHVVALSSTSRFTKTDSSDPAEQLLAQRFASGEESLISWAEQKGITWTILRPTLIYGLGRDKNVSQIARLIRRFGFFPLLGAAQGLRQPVHLQDLAAASVAALTRPAAKNRAFNISGAEVLPYREMVNRIFLALGKKPRLVVVPLAIFKLAVYFMRLLPAFRAWSPAMVERMNCDMTFDHADAARDLGFLPRPFLPTREDMPN